VKRIARRGTDLTARVGPPARLPSLSGTIELQEQLNTNAFGPALVVSTLWSSNLLRAPPNAPPKGINFPPPNVSPHGHSGPREEWGYEFEQARAPISAPHYEPTGDIPNVPIVVNLWSTQGSLKWTGELWEGGSTRDDLIFHPVYAASKAALSGVSMQLAREMRVSHEVYGRRLGGC
jgi:NAD(P)-dependent dehydrogenase (short-subunit alcohol dehydrogenase family)